MQNNILNGSNFMAHGNGALDIMKQMVDKMKVLTTQNDKYKRTFKNKKPEKEQGTNQNNPVAIAKLISDIIAEKRSESENSNIKFSCSFMNDGEAASIQINPSDFQTMLSNIITNSVEACNDQTGKIDIVVSSNSNRVRIMIADNGCGMPDEIVNKIRDNIAVTYGKDNHQGLGLTQVRKTLANSNGRLSITSSPDSTIITLTFLDAKKVITHNAPKTVDLILVDNDDMTADIVTNYVLKDKYVYVYETAREFLNEISLHPTSTKILIAYKFRNETINGIEIVNQLQKLGYTNCYLNAAWPFSGEDELPNHIKLLDVYAL